MQNTVMIVGAGIGGLSLASILHRRGVPVIVFEGDASPDVRAQGGLLDLHEGSGQRALHDAGLHDRFLALVRPGEDAKRIVDHHGTVLLDKSADPASGRPEIDRGDLRRLLLGSLPVGAIRWGFKVAAIEPSDSGHSIRFTNGDVVAARLVVGADGAWSRVRPLVTDAKPIYSGLCFIELSVAADDLRAAQAGRTIGQGTLMACAPGQGILAHRNADGSIAGYVAVERDEAWIAHWESGDRSAIINEVAAMFDDWSPELRALLAIDGATSVIRPIRALPSGLSWSPTRGVTLLGDAAHLMSPFAGVGANLAMLDAVELADDIGTASGGLDAALAGYERRMFDRSAGYAARSAANLRAFFGAESPGSVVAMFSGGEP